MTTTALTNQQIRLAARPVGLPKPTDWKSVSEPVRELADGEILVKNIYLSLDPAMRASSMVPAMVASVAIACLRAALRGMFGM